MHHDFPPLSAVSTVNQQRQSSRLPLGQIPHSWTDNRNGVRDTIKPTPNNDFLLTPVAIHFSEPPASLCLSLHPIPRITEAFTEIHCTLTTTPIYSLISPCGILQGMLLKWPARFTPAGQKCLTNQPCLLHITIVVFQAGNETRVAKSGVVSSLCFN